MNKNIIIFFFIALTFFSCKKDVDTEAIVSAAQDYAYADAYIQEIFKIVDEASKNEPAVYKLSTLDCATITLIDTSGTFPKTLNIDYGLVNCIGSDGRRRRGMIKVIYNDSYSNPGSIINVNFENFFINDFGVFNPIIIANTGNIVQQQHKLSFADLRFHSASDGRSIKLNGYRIFTLIDGDATQAADDDIFSVQGSFSGTARSGSGISATIAEALQLKYSCRSYLSGTANVKITDNDGLFNYGLGECDDNASVIIDGREYYIRLE